MCARPPQPCTRYAGAGCVPDGRHLGAGAAAAGAAADAQPGGLARVAHLHGAHPRTALSRSAHPVVVTHRESRMLK